MIQQVTLDVEESKMAAFMEVVRGLNFVSVREPEDTTEIPEAVKQEVRERIEKMRSGQTGTVSLSEFEANLTTFKKQNGI